MNKMQFRAELFDQRQCEQLRSVIARTIQGTDAYKQSIDPFLA
jgi:hypothetical protein